MNSDEIKRQIDRFSVWRYQFDLNGHLTAGEKQLKRQQWRRQHFFDPVVELSGGSLEGKRVLDLACSAGYWSYCATQAGADYVLGIDGREEHIEQCELVFGVKEIDESRYDFITSDMYKVDFSEYGPFDVVLCPGVFYHVSKHVDLIEKISAVNPDLLVIDTITADLPGSSMRIWHDQSEKGNASVDYELVMTPTSEAVADIAKQFGYGVRALKPRFEVENGQAKFSGARDYYRDKRKRRAFVCSKQTDLSGVETEPIKRPAQPAKKAEAAAKTPETTGERELLAQTEKELGKLLSSRRFKLAQALGSTLQALGVSKGEAPDDRLRELQGQIKARRR